MAESNNTKKPLSLVPFKRIISPPLNFIPPNTPPQLYTSAIEYFSSIPWCASLLQLPDTIPFVPSCMNPSSSSHEQFLGATLAANPSRGLRHILCLLRPDDASHLHDPERPIVRVTSLFAVGEGLCGYEGVLHGGMIMTMADEAMGTLSEINTVFGKKGDAFKYPTVTAALEIQFLRPGPLDGALVVNVWIEGTEGRRTMMRCDVRDGKGVEVARSSSTFVGVKPKI